MSPSSPSYSLPLNLSPQTLGAISPLSTAFTPKRSLNPLSTAFTQTDRGVGGLPSLFLATRHSPLATFLALCFHTLTNCFSHKPFIFTTIRIAPGCHPQTLPIQDFLHLCALCVSPINYVFSFTYSLFAAFSPLFSQARPLFSSACSLFSKNTRVGVGTWMPKSAPVGATTYFRSETV